MLGDYEATRKEKS